MVTSPRSLGSPPSPPITTPGAVNLPVLQQLASNIRERIQRIEAQLPAATAAPARTTSTQGDSSSLQRQISSLRSDVDRLLAAAGGTGGDDLLLLASQGDAQATRDDSDRLLWSADAAPSQPCNDVSAVLASQVFGA